MAMNGIQADVYGLKLFYDADYHAVDWKNRPDFEPFMRPLIVRSQGLFVDAGCNAGFHTLSAASCGNHVIAVDANFLNAALLHKTIVMNGLTKQVKVIPVALGRTEGMTTVDIVPSNSSVSNGGLPVAVVTLDRIVADYNPKGLPVGLIKIDVEGHEEFVIEGALLTITAFHPVIVFEYCTQLAKTPRVFDVVKGIGYDCKMIGKNELPFDGEMDGDPMNVYMFECHRIQSKQATPGVS